MRTAWLLVVAAGVVVGAMPFATCNGPPAPIQEPSTLDEPIAARTNSVQRNRKDAPLAEEKPAEAPTPAPPRDLVASAVATTEFLNADASIAAPKHVVRGRVLNARREPIAGAEVSVISQWLPTEVARRLRRPQRATSSLTTGADGAFALTYWEGGARALHIVANGVYWLENDIADDKVHEIVVPDQATGAVVVHVTSAADGAAIHDARLALETLSPPTWGTVWEGNTYDESAKSDNREAAGVYVFHPISAGPAMLDVAAPGLAAEVGRPVAIPMKGETVVRVALRIGVTVRGRVVDAGTDLGVANAHVTLGDWSDRVPFGLPSGDEAGLGTMTDEEGRFVLANAPLEPRSYRSFAAAAEGYANAGFLMAAPETSSESVTVKLRRPAGLIVRCVRDERPVVGAVVAVFSDHDATPPGGMRSWLTSTVVETTGADGRATLAGLHPGTDGIELRTRFYVDGVPVLERTYPPLVAGETRDLGDVVLAPTLTLRGVVLDADGKPVAGATVVAAQGDATDADRAALGAAVMERSGRRAETAPDGTFALMGLSTGLWDLYAYASWESPGRLEAGVDPSRGTSTLRLPRVVALTGRVVDAKGAPVANANVASYRAFFGSRMSVSCLTTGDGSFGIPGYAEGTPEVEVTVTPREGADGQAFRARPGAAGTEFRLR